ncbi:MAG: MFS transporter [Deltaproteobacteria bacterium]|nr:MFS transporter [Deltaproteobacteria bacterium]
MSPIADSPAVEVQLAPPWYQEISHEQWHVFWAAFMGWVVDAFDFNVLAFILIDIQKSFAVDRALAGALGTVTLVTRALGGIAAGTAADKVGRKLPLMVSILWFSLFAFLSGFSRSYAMLFALRALFGIGMGGEWAAGTPLTLEHWPARSRGMVSGMLQGGWFWGYLLAAVAFEFIYPMFSAMPHLGWRVMFWIAIVPAFFTAWLLAGVSESPVWLEHQRAVRAAQLQREAVKKPKLSLVQIFQHDLLGTTIQTTAVVSAFLCAGYATIFWYPTLLRDAGRSPLPYLVAFNLGAVAGVAICGRMSETVLGRRGAVSIAALAGLGSIPLYLHTTSPATLWLGALTMGAFGCGMVGVAPAYVTERFPTATRGIGPGFCYHAAAAVASIIPVLMGSLQDRGVALIDVMTIAIAITLILCAGLIWLGPETRGRNFNAT